MTLSPLHFVINWPVFTIYICSRIITMISLYHSNNYIIVIKQQI